MTKLIQAIAFDKDGTLLDFHATWNPVNWAAAHVAARNDPDLAELLMVMGGFDPHSDRFAAGSAMAQDTAEGIAALWLPRTVGWTHETLVDAINAMFAQAEAAPVDGLADVLTNLRSAGLHLGVVTSDAEAPARSQLTGLGLADHFTFIAGYDSGYRPKPDPAAILAFCAQVGTEPAATAFVGDNAHDMEAGRRAGCGLVVGVLTGTSGRSDLAPLADAVLDSVSDLPGVLAA